MLGKFASPAAMIAGFSLFLTFALGMDKIYQFLEAGRTWWGTYISMHSTVAILLVFIALFLFFVGMLVKQAID